MEHAGVPQRGQLEAIWLKRVRRGPMDPVASAELVRDQGLAGNANQGGRRQVTIIEAEVWESLRRQLGDSLQPSARRANLMVSGIRLRETRGRLLEIGECVLEIAGETKPCEWMDDAMPGLKMALEPEWRGGVFAMVREGGTIRVGDAATLHSETAAPDPRQPRQTA